jgi:ribosomal protein S18 acetylase RimI-like enzyme
MITIRDGCAEDAATLAAFARDTFVAAFGHTYATDDLAAFLAETYAPAIQADELADPETTHLLAWDKDKDRLVGFAKFGAVKLPISAATTARELHRLYVDPERHGSGLGAALMRQAMAEMLKEGAQSVYLGVWSQNHGAQRFYGRFGFEIVGEYEFIVGAARDREFIMHATLPAAGG